jgi:hypothetical protein
VSKRIGERERERGREREIERERDREIETKNRGREVREDLNSDYCIQDYQI